ncbi:MAG: ABC transporter substrate-binding protein [Janthinobacterium lividum]
MRITRTVAAAAATALVSVVALAGCGSGTPGVSASQANQTPGSGPVTINFWSQKFEDYQTAWETKWVDTFNKSQSDVKVVLTVVPADAWAQKLKAAQAAGKAPDVYTINYGSIPPAVADGQLKALNGLVPDAAFADVTENVKKLITVKGQQYAYPWNTEPSAVLYYRKDLYSAAGLDPAKPPATWAELTADAKVLTRDKVYGISTASTAADLAWSSWGLQYDAAGHLPMSADWSQAQANDPAYVQLAQFYKGLYDDGSMPKQALAPYADGAPLGQGKVAQQISGSWVIGQLRQEYPKMLDNIAVAPVPSMDGAKDKPTATLGGWTLAIDAKSTHDAQGAAFIKYLLGGDTSVMLDYFKAAGFSKYAPRTSVAQAIEKDPAAQADPYRKIITDEVVPYAAPEATYPNDLNVYFATAIEKSMKGGDPASAMADAQQQMTSYIAKNKLAGTNPQQ